MEKFVETGKMLKKKFGSRQRVLNGLIDLVVIRRVNVATYFKLKRCFDVATEIFRSRHRNQLNKEKSCRDRKHGLCHETS